MEKNITYLFLVYKNASFIYHTIERLSGDNVQFFMHVDIKSKEDFGLLKNIPNVRFASKRFSCKWGDAGIVYAIAHCLKEISEETNTDYVVLMSESDYPVKSSKYIYEYITSSNKDFATISVLPNENPLNSPGGYWIEGGMRRVNCYAVRFGEKGIATIEPGCMNWGNIRQFGKLLIKAPFKLSEAIKYLFKPKRKCPDGLRWCGGDLWFILKIETVSKIVDYLRKDDTILKEAEMSDCLDEVVYPTLIDAFSVEEDRVNSTLRYINWSRGIYDSPMFLTMEDSMLIDNQKVDKDILFVRKIEDFEVAEYIDQSFS